ncbi:MAG: DNA-binding protein [archaeon]|nr:DNA-binding protein [archaeon]
MTTDEEARQQALQKMLEESKKHDREAQAEQALNQALKNLLTDEAKQRLYNVRLVNNSLFTQAVQTIAYLSKQGRIEEKIGDAELKQLLEKLSAKKETTIRRK